MTLTRYGLREWLTASILVGLLAIGVAILGWWWWLIPLGVFWIAFAAFFRDPFRPMPDNLPAGVMLSPSDGHISSIHRVEEHEVTGGGPAMVVRIFLSVLDVHVNWIPHDGTVIDVKHVPGKYLNAQTEESAKVNEYVLTTIRLPDGETMGLRQVAGMIARRIVCPLKPGQEIRRGYKFGMIKFGSTTEITLPRPDDVTVHVREGERVRGGLTLLATLAEPAPVARDSVGASSTA